LNILPIQHFITAGTSKTRCAPKQYFWSTGLHNPIKGVNHLYDYHSTIEL